MLESRLTSRGNMASVTGDEAGKPSSLPLWLQPVLSMSNMLDIFKNHSDHATRTNELFITARSHVDYAQGMWCDTQQNSSLWSPFSSGVASVSLFSLIIVSWSYISYSTIQRTQFHPRFTKLTAETKKKKCSDATPKHFSSLRCWMLCHKHGVWRTNMDTEINFSSQEADAPLQKAEFRRAVPQDADWCDRTLAPNKTVFFFSVLFMPQPE